MHEHSKRTKIAIVVYSLNAEPETNDGTNDQLCAHNDSKNQISGATFHISFEWKGFRCFDALHNSIIAKIFDANTHTHTPIYSAQTQRHCWAGKLTFNGRKKIRTFEELVNDHWPSMTLRFSVCFLRSSNEMTNNLWKNITEIFWCDLNDENGHSCIQSLPQEIIQLSRFIGMDFLFSRLSSIVFLNTIPKWSEVESIQDILLFSLEGEYVHSYKFHLFPWKVWFF